MLLEPGTGPVRAATHLPSTPHPDVSRLVDVVTDVPTRDRLPGVVAPAVGTPDAARHA